MRQPSAPPPIEFGVGQPACHFVLAPENNGIGFVSRAQQVFGEVQLRLRKPASPRHFSAVEQDLAARVAHDLAEIPHRMPESFRSIDGPAMKARIVALVDSVEEGGQKRLFETSRIGCPNGLLTWSIQ